MTLTPTPLVSRNGFGLNPCAALLAATVMMLSCSTVKEKRPAAPSRPKPVVQSETAAEPSAVVKEPSPSGAGEKLMRTDEDWRKLLSPEQFRVTREHGTEKAFTNAYWDTKDAGTYHCVCCGAAVFSSEHKFDSGTGWPSFYQPAAGEIIATRPDDSFFGPRTEVHCAKCDAHFGHVFSDGPKPTGLRYCINSAALKFEKK